MITIEHLTKRYGDKVAVDDISLTIKSGEIVGFLGPNGAGKTTTMNILTGYLSSTAGTVEIDGISMQDDPLEAKRQIGFLPEQPPLYMDMTVEEYLNFVYDLKGCRFARKEHLAEICQVVGIDHVYRRVIRNLSKGYRQRVGIAQALVGNPKVVIFDEPTVGLDPKQIIEIRNLISRLGKRHTVILSTHILPEVQAVCDRIVIINEGKIIANERTEEISKLLENSHRLAVRICGPEKEVLAALKKTRGVASADVAKEHEIDDGVTYYVVSQPGVDVRKPIFNTMAERKFAIIGMDALGHTLEDVFIALVDRESNAEAKRDGFGPQVDISGITAPSDGEDTQDDA